MNGIIAVVEASLSKTAYSRHWQSDEYTGACPWCGGTNRFHVWPDAEDIPDVGPIGRYSCMGSEAGRSGCGRKGNGIDYVCERRGIPFADACKVLGVDAQKVLDYRRSQNGTAAGARPAKERVEMKSLSEINATWRSNALALARQASSYLAGEPLDYLTGRGLQVSTIRNHVLGYYPSYKWVNASLWGAAEGRMSIPRGIVIPWFNDENEVICIRFRRLPGDESDEARKHYGVDKKTGQINRYKSLFGSSSHHLYGGDLLFPGCDAALFEGELDALVTTQEAGQSPICIVATGSTVGARSAMSRRKLAQCSQVLVCYNADEPGDKASNYWLEHLKNSRRWRPLWSDANDMMKDGINIAEWLILGFSVESELATTTNDKPFICSVCGVDLNSVDRPFYNPDGVPFCNYHEDTKEAYCSRKPDRPGSMQLSPWRRSELVKG